MIKEFKNSIAKLLRFFFARAPKDFKEVPIFINNYNRLSTTKKLAESLERRGYKNIHILDNQSTYPPLLDYYKTTSCKVHFLKKNYGSKAYWKSNLWLKYLNSYFVLTDSDVVPLDECPDDFLADFFKILKKYPKAHKVGFSLKIDDLPDSFENKEKVIAWEDRYFKNEQEENLFIAPIDTTFAFYRPFSRAGKRDGSTLMFRTGLPYQARHLPWYLDNNNLDEEEQYYLNSLATRTHWSRQNVIKDDVVEISNCLEALTQQKTILYPTDTVWGLGCDATSKEAVAKIYQIKQREESKSLIVLVDSIEMLQNYVGEIPDKALEILKTSERPTTIIYKNPKALAENAVAKDNTVAIRIVEDEFCKKLILELDKPIVSTSANISGEATPTAFKEINPKILEAVDYVVNLRQDETSAQSSRIIRILDNGDLEVLRD